MNISINLTSIAYASQRVPFNKNLNFSRQKIPIYIYIYLFIYLFILNRTYSHVRKNCLLHNYMSSLGSKVLKIPIYKQISPASIRSR